jgi:hypothetical protein
MEKAKEAIWMAQAVLLTDGMTFEVNEVVNGESSIVNRSFPVGKPFR